MDSDKISKYLNEDFARAVKFYDDRAKESKCKYQFFSIYIISVSALLTPLIAFIPNDSLWRIISAIFTASIVIASSLLAYLKSHENWLSYRASWDALERERRLFENRAGKYHSSIDPENEFVEQVEGILAKEAIDFYSRYAKVEENKDKQTPKNK